MLEPVQRAQVQRALAYPEPASPAQGLLVQGQKDHPMPEQAPALPEQERALEQEPPAPSVQA